MISTARTISMLKSMTLAATIFGLAACADNRQPGDMSAGQDQGVASQANLLTGTINDGPIDNTVISIYNHEGRLLKSVPQNQLSQFSTEIPSAKHHYPLLLKARTDVSMHVVGDPGFVLMAAIADPEAKHHINLSPYSTLITKIAGNMDGGLDRRNLKAAQDIVLKQFNFGLYGALKDEPVHSKLTDNNGHVMIKASEALAETIRRTQDSLKQHGYRFTTNMIISMLAADLADGQLDGQGEKINARVSAVTHIIAGEVAIEAITNDLKVNNNDAMAELDYAISTSFPASRFSTENVHITEELIAQAYAATSTANAIIPSPHLDVIESRLKQLTAFTQPERAKRDLPATSEGYLSGVASYLASAPEQEIKRANQLAARSRS